MGTRLLSPWDFLGKSTGVDCHFLLQGIFPTQGSNPGLLYCRQTLYHLSHRGSPFRMGRREVNRSLQSQALGHRKNRSGRCSSHSVHKMVQKLRSQPLLRGEICSLSKTPRRLINEAFTVAKIPSDILSIQIECSIRNGWSS